MAGLDLGLDLAVPLDGARPCPTIGVAGTSPAMTTSSFIQTNHIRPVRAVAESVHAVDIGRALLSP
jgi:hypothetical protein